jgi:precorrin-6A/cobalt-precorrin-6A reductase
MRDKEPKRILILGGTAEASNLAHRLARETPDTIVVTSLAGRLTAQPDLPGIVRVGGFGGLHGLIDFLRLARINRVIDATHPFAATISAHAALACAELEIPLERIHRPMWRKHPGDRWRWAATIEMAARMATGGSSRARRVFLTIGAQELAPFARRGGPFYLIRMIEPPPRRLPFRHYSLVLGRGPFALAEEMALMENFDIDLLVSKSSGGPATEAKIEAARRLGIPVVMVRRPALSAGAAP